MSQLASSGIVTDHHFGSQESLTAQQIDGVLAHFRAWLQEAPPAPPEPPSAEETIDLFTLLSQFTALRHEVHLQTKAARTQQELNAETLEQLRQALAARPERAEKDRDEILRPFLKNLIDVRDALALAEREVLKVRAHLLPLLAETVAAPIQPESRHSWWERFWSRNPSPPIPEHGPGLNSAAKQRVRQLLDSVVTGYTMSLQRADRSLEQVGLEPIECVGQTYDPEKMEALAVVTETNRSAAEVVEEIRRGYSWRGKIFRVAQVSVSKT